MIILEENFKWHLEAFASELFKCSLGEQNYDLKNEFIYKVSV